MHVVNPDSTHGKRDSSVVRGPRIIRDNSSGDVITVVERRADGVAGARGSCCLIFSTDRGFTRVWSYPDNWLELSDPDLKAVSEFRRSHSA